jgi:hypothetical protein
MNFDYKPDDILKRAEASLYLRHKYRIGSLSYLHALATRGGGPIFQKGRHHTTYRVSDLDDWAQGKSATLKKDEISIGEDSK